MATTRNTRAFSNLAYLLFLAASGLVAQSRGPLIAASGGKTAARTLTDGTGLGPRWTAINSGLPDTTRGISGLAIDPAVPSTLYAWSTDGDVFKSLDGAATWQSVGGVGGVNLLAIDPRKTATLYAATNHGVVKSMDGGASWGGASASLTDPVTWLAVDPVTSTTLYAVTAQNIVAGGIIFKSTDAGANWSSISSELPSVAWILFVYLNPISPSTIYAVGYGGGFKSVDGGTSWNAFSNDVPSSLAIDPVSPNTIYEGSSATNYGGISKSTDGGQSWQVIHTGIPRSAYVGPLAIDPTKPSTIYAIYNNNGGSGVLKSTDGGQSWNIATVITSYDFFFIAQLAIDPSTPSTLYVGYYNQLNQVGGILKSADGGQTWNAASAGLDNFGIRLQAMAPLNASTVYASEAGTLFKSVDSGASWNSIGSPPPVVYTTPQNSRVISSMLIDATNPNIFYLETKEACGGLLYKSSDGGANWSGLGNSTFSACDLSGLMFADPTNPKTIYVAESDWVDGGDWLIKSVDGGANFNVAWNGYQGFVSHLNALVIDPTNPTILYAGLDYPGGVWKSSDGGATVNYLGLGASGVNALAIDPNHPSTLYASAQVPNGFWGLVKSTDGGTSWSAINYGLKSVIDTRTTINSLVLTPGNSSVLYAATAGLGVFQSVDGGTNWNPFNDGLTNFDVRNLIVASGTPHTIYAGTSAGIFKIDDAAANQSSISASPNPCVLSGLFCSTYLTWSTTGIANAQVWVRIGDGTETLFWIGQTCGGTDCSAPWIQGNGLVYTFTVYDCDTAVCTYTDHSNAQALASVQVKGINGSTGAP